MAPAQKTDPTESAGADNRLPTGGDGATARTDDYEALRRLLLGGEQTTTLDRITAAGPVDLDAHGLSQILPDAVRLREGQDDALGVALSQTIETGLKTSVERNPQPVVDAIFPVIGPAIRRSIQSAMASSLESINQSVNYGLSVRGLKWRYEARRDGLSFGEVVLRHTLAYRVEQIMLVHRPTGILLHHVVAPDVKAGHDPDLVSAMLTAIGQFVEDSFGEDDNELDAIQVGDLTVWIEPGPHAVLAAVIRGHPPQDLRVKLKQALEDFHKQYGRQLVSFAGATESFDSARGVFEPCMEAQYADPPAEGLSPKLIFFLVLAGALLAWWAWSTWQRRSHEGAYLDALEAAPGIEVLREEHSDGTLQIVGVRDPISADPMSFVAAAKLDSSDVTARWIPFTSDEPRIVAQRFVDAVEAPPGMRFRADAAGIVYAMGEADTMWAAAARAALPDIEHANGLDLSGVTSPLVQVAARLASHRLLFDGPEPVAGQDIETIRSDLRSLAEVLRKMPPGSAVLEIIGHTDDTGTRAFNDALSVRRAEAARTLFATELEGVPVRIVGMGDSESQAEGANPSNRRIAFRVR